MSGISRLVKHAVVDGGGTVTNSLSKSLRSVARSLEEWSKYGLYTDDILVQNDDVVAAVKMLPKDVAAEKEFRLQRAFAMNYIRNYLPKEQWTTMENDENYLKPYLEKVIQDRLTSELWDALDS